MLAAAPTALRTLILEDDPQTCAAMRRALAKEGFDAKCATSVGAALVELEAGQKPAAAIIDLRLPDGSGALVLWRIRRNWGHDVPVAVVTGVPDPLSHPDLIREPPDKLFTKPFDLWELVAWLKSVT